MTERDIPRITRRALCRYWKTSAEHGTWMCALHHHRATKFDGCTWGKEKS